MNELDTTTAVGTGLHLTLSEDILGGLRDFACKHEDYSDVRIVFGDVEKKFTFDDFLSRLGFERKEK